LQALFENLQIILTEMSNPCAFPAPVETITHLSGDVSPDDCIEDLNKKIHTVWEEKFNVKTQRGRIVWTDNMKSFSITSVAVMEKATVRQMVTKVEKYHHVVHVSTELLFFWSLE
jgi:hypothetical protein